MYRITNDGLGLVRVITKTTHAVQSYIKNKIIFQYKQNKRISQINK